MASTAPRTTQLNTFHKDLIHDVSFDYYGQMIATCSSDQTIKIWQYNPTNDGTMANPWVCMQEITKQHHTHKAAIQMISWAHPVFGSIFASCSTDKKINIFALRDSSSHCSMYNRRQKKQPFTYDRVFLEFHDAVAIAFAPQHLGLKLSIVRNDGVIKILTARDITNLSQWTEEYSINIAHNNLLPYHNYLHINDIAKLKNLSRHESYVPHAIKDKKRASLRKSKSFSTQNTDRINHPKREHIKSFCISWNESKWELPSFAVGTNKNRVFIYKYFDKTNHETDNEHKMDVAMKRAVTSIHSMKKNIDWHCVSKIKITKKDKKSFDVRGVSWSHHLARKYHLLAIGCSDGYVRIIKIMRNERIAMHNTNNNGTDNHKVQWSVIFESNIHNDAVWKVKWNVTGNVLLSAGDDAKIYLWKRNRINNIDDNKKYVPVCISERTPNNKRKDTVHDDHTNDTIHSQ
eukprot:287527_1